MFRGVFRVFKCLGFRCFRDENGFGRKYNWTKPHLDESVCLLFWM